MIEVMDQLSPAVMDSIIHVAVSDSVSAWKKRINQNYKQVYRLLTLLYKNL